MVSKPKPGWGNRLLFFKFKHRVKAKWAYITATLRMARQKKELTNTEGCWA
jgi:hypothetical protein